MMGKLSSWDAVQSQMGSPFSPVREVRAVSRCGQGESSQTLSGTCAISLLEFVILVCGGNTNRGIAEVAMMMTSVEASYTCLGI